MDVGDSSELMRMGPMHLIMIIVPCCLPDTLYVVSPWFAGDTTHPISKQVEGMKNAKEEFVLNLLQIDGRTRITVKISSEIQK